jgi:hypothetical protein
VVVADYAAWFAGGARRAMAIVGLVAAVAERGARAGHGY